MIRFALRCVELDTSIQCRASIDTAIVDEYAEAMRAGDEFPPVELYGTQDMAWPADGWHRILAAKKNGESAITANLHPGGRVDALRAALSANAIHGHRRSNQDKRRAVEIALREFGALSSRAIAEMCGVGDQLVRSLRPDEPALRDSRNATVTTSDGRQYPARREPKPEAAPPLPTPQPQQAVATTPAPTHAASIRPHERQINPPSWGMQFAFIAVMKLKEIARDDIEREQAFRYVEDWIRENR